MAKIVITAPHSSSFIPPELINRYALPHEQIHDVFDSGTFEVLKLISNKNITILPAEVSRLVVDLNRFPDDHRNIGIFREKTFRGNQIFIEGKHFTEKEKNYYRDKYYTPWHKKLLDALTLEPILLHIDLHNTDETKFCLSAYTQGKPLRMQDFTDFDIANRSAYKNPYEPIDSAGLTFPGKEMEFLIASAKKHFEKITTNPRITGSSFMKGGAIIQIARDKANWVNGTARSLQFEIQRKYFTKQKDLAEAIQGLTNDIVNHLI